MAKVTQKDTEPVMRLLQISRQRDAQKANEEKILPLLEKFEKANSVQTDAIELAMKKMNEAVDEVNKQMELVNEIATQPGNNKSRQNPLFYKMNHYVRPAIGFSYYLNGKTYYLTPEQNVVINKASKEIMDSLDLKYLTIEAKIKLSGDFKEIARTLTDNGILMDTTVK